MQPGQVILSAGVDPFRPARIGLAFEPGMTLLDLVDRALDALARKMKCAKRSLAWFYDVGVVSVGGKTWPRELWGMVRPKPDAHVELLAPAPGKGKIGGILLVLAAVALTVVTAGIAGGALAGALGTGTLAAGSLSANLLAAGVGLLGSLAIKALTPTPSIPKPDSQSQEALSLAGFQPNPLQRDDVIARVAGLMRVSPQPLVPAYTILSGKKQYVKAMVGLEGNYDISDVRINEIAIADIPGATYTVSPGNGTVPATELSNDFRIEDRVGIELLNYELKDEENANDQIKDQDNPSSSYSQWHPLPDKPIAATRYGFRLVFDGGIVRSTDAEICAVPIRIRIRRKGTGTWRYFPELHFKALNKGAPFQQHVELFWGEWNGRTPAFNGGVWASRNDGINCYVALAKVGAGEAFEFNADSYFNNLSAAPGNQVPVLAGYTSGAVTVSASGEKDGTTQAWKCFDNNNTTYWQPPNNSLPGQWVKVDWGIGNTKTILCYSVDRSPVGQVFPKVWRLQGSDTGGAADAEWVTLHKYNIDAGLNQPFVKTYLNVSVIGAFRYHRIVFDANRGAANEELSVGTIGLYADWSMARMRTTGGGSNDLLGGIAARKVSLKQEGVEINLDTAGWPSDAYEIQVRRGWAYVVSQLDLYSSTNVQPDQYVYDGATWRGHFFDSYDDSGTTKIWTPQYDIQSRSALPLIQKYYPIRPIAEDIEPKLTRLMVSVPGLDIQSISCLAQGYAREWNGSVWVDEAVPSSNPAAYYRDALLLTDTNLDALPGEVVDEDSLIDYFEHCDTNGYTFNGILQDQNVHDALTLFASVGLGRPKHGGQWGVAIDHDRSAESPVAILTPENSRDAGTEVSFDQIPHALRVSFADSVDDYRLKDVVVYRPGYTVDTATEIESLPPYTGIVTEAAAIARATYDFRQMLYRKATYRREVNIAGLTFGIGDLVALSDEVVSRDVYFGMIKEILTSGGNVTGFRLYGAVEITQSAEAISDTEGVLGTFGCMVQLREGGTFTAEITEQADTAVVTLATPVPNTNQFAVDLYISIGALGRETKRVVVQRVEHQGGENFLLSLLPEGIEIFA